MPERNVLVLGDGMADWLAYGLEDAYTEQPDMGVIRKHKTASGLIRYQPKGDPADWAAAAKGILATEKPDAIDEAMAVLDEWFAEDEGAPFADALNAGKEMSRALAAHDLDTFRRLFTQDVFARFDRSKGGWKMQKIRQTDDDCIDLWIVEQVVILAVALFRPMFFYEGRAPLIIDVGTGIEFRSTHSPQGLSVHLSRPTCSNNAHVQFVHARLSAQLAIAASLDPRVCVSIPKFFVSARADVAIAAGALFLARQFSQPAAAPFFVQKHRASVPGPACGFGFGNVNPAR